MNRYTALFTFLSSALLASVSGVSHAQERLESYVPPPMFGSAATTPTTSDNVISFPVTTTSQSNSVNPAAPPAAEAPYVDPITEGIPVAPLSPVAPPAPVVPVPAPEMMAPAAPVKAARKPRVTPPVPKPRPAVLQASQAYIEEQKKKQEEEAAKKAEADAAAKAAIEKAAQENPAKTLVQEKINDKPKDVVVPQPVLPEKSKMAETIEPAPKQSVSSPLPPLPVSGKPAPVNPKLFGQELANPSVEEILENLDANAPVAKPIPKTPLPVGPTDLSERMVTVRTVKNSGPNVRIHAKRAAPKKQIVHSFFIMFEPEATELTQLGETNFEKSVLPIMNDDQDLNIQIQAYASANKKGAEEAQRISLARANAIRTFLLEKNIAADRIQIHALGAQATKEPGDRVDIMLQKELTKPLSKAPADGTPVNKTP